MMMGRRRLTIFLQFPRGYLKSECSKVVKGGTKWRAKRPLTSLRNELHLGAEGIRDVIADYSNS
jgi:hypothetical protein